jgi:hypothetical protein
MHIYQAINQCDFSLFRDSFDRKGPSRIFPLKEVASKLNILLKRIFCTDQFIAAEQLVLNGFIAKAQCLVAMLQLIRSDRQFNPAAHEFPTLLEDAAFKSPFSILALLNADTADPSELLSARVDILENVVLPERETDTRRLWLILCQTLDLLTQAIDILGRSNFRPPVAMAQHLMAVSLVLDKSRLFRQCSLVTELDEGGGRIGVFGRGLYYNWHLALSGLSERSDFQVPLAAALTRLSLSLDAHPNIEFSFVSDRTVAACGHIFGSRVANVLRQKALLTESRRGLKSQLFGEDDKSDKNGEMDADTFISVAKQVALQKARKVKT